MFFVLVFFVSANNIMSFDWGMLSADLLARCFRGTWPIVQGRGLP